MWIQVFEFKFSALINHHKIIGKEVRKKRIFYHSVWNFGEKFKHKYVIGNTPKKKKSESIPGITS